MIPWHRLFGMVLYDWFLNTAWTVLVELDLSFKSQRLDIVIVRRSSDSETDTPPLPDGLAPLAEHNLITFKSVQDTLDAWSIKELVGHFVNYRKQYSPSLDQLLPESQFRLYAVSMRFPRSLAAEVPFRQVGEGVYDLRWGTDWIRVLVLNEIPATEQNMVLNLFSGDAARVQFAASHYRPRSRETSAVVNELFHKYDLEGVPMPYTMQDFLRDVTKEHLDLLSPEERIANLTPKQLTAKLTPQQRIADLTPEQRIADLTPQQRIADLTPEQRIADLTPEQLTAKLTPEELTNQLLNRLSVHEIEAHLKHLSAENQN